MRQDRRHQSVTTSSHSAELLHTSLNCNQLPKPVRQPSAALSIITEQWLTALHFRFVITLCAFITKQSMRSTQLGSNSETYHEVLLLAQEPEEVILYKPSKAHHIKKAANTKCCCHARSRFKLHASSKLKALGLFCCSFSSVWCLCTAA